MSFKVVCISDLHGELLDTPPCDLLIIAGDVCPGGDYLDQIPWLQGPFKQWLKSREVKYTVGIAGNHDFYFEHYRKEGPMPLPWIYLCDEGVELGGFKIYGHPWSRRYNNWAFNIGNDELAMKNANIPEDTDILITHAPPKGVLDVVTEGHDLNGFMLGDPYMRRRIIEIKPRLHVFGHIHSGYGEKILKDMYEGGSTLCVNASLMDEYYAPTHKPWEIEL